MGLTVHSDAFADGQEIPKRYTEDGENVSPPLAWSAVPEGTKELALIVDDPDAPRTEPWVHWVLYRIPPDVRALPEGVPATAAVQIVATAAQGQNSWGTVGYRGPAPPKGHGRHHYHFRLYALDAPVAQEARLGKDELLAAIKEHVLGQADLVGTYER